MKASKRIAIGRAIEVFKKKGILYREKDNGHFLIDTVNYWATTEKWYDPINDIRGQGMNSFLDHLRSQGRLGDLQDVVEATFHFEGYEVQASKNEHGKVTFKIVDPEENITFTRVTI